MQYLKLLSSLFGEQKQSFSDQLRKMATQALVSMLIKQVSATLRERRMVRKLERKVTGKGFEQPVVPAPVRVAYTPEDRRRRELERYRAMRSAKVEPAKKHRFAKLIALGAVLAAALGVAAGVVKEIEGQKAA